MALLLEPLLPPPQIQAINAALGQAGPEAWRDGGETAGWHARGVKHNHQLDRSSALHQELSESIREHLLRHPLVQATAFPRRIHGLLFSRSGIGEGYGRHVDNAFMAHGRADVSFTVFLTDPDSYGGGSLMLEGPEGETAIRLKAGSVIPSTRARWLSFFLTNCYETGRPPALFLAACTGSLSMYSSRRPSAGIFGWWPARS